MKAQDLIAGFQAATHENITTGGVTYIAFTSEELCKFIEAVLKAHAAVEPDDEGWIEWDGDARGPNIPLDAVVEAELTNEHIKMETNRWWIGLTGKGFNNWDKNDRNASVILRYRVVK